MPKTRKPRSWEWDEIDRSELRGRERSALSPEKREIRDRMIIQARGDLDRRTLPHPNRCLPITLEEKIARALRDERRVIFTLDQVKEIAERLGIEPAAISPYQKRRRSVAVLGENESIDRHGFEKIVKKSSAAVERKRRAVGRKIEREEIEGRLIARARRGR